MDREDGNSSTPVIGLCHKLFEVDIHRSEGSGNQKPAGIGDNVQKLQIGSAAWNHANGALEWMAGSVRNPLVIFKRAWRTPAQTARSYRA